VLAGPLLSIIDDDEGVRQSLQSLVESVGYRAGLFDSAEAFLNSADLNYTRCIISDVQMPGMTGIAMAEQLERIGSRTPIILISAYATDELLRGLASSCVVAMLPKPLQLNALIDEISRALNLGT
jgi:FixJ family two-component response regulator